MLFLYFECGLIYRQRGRCQSELDFLLLLDLGTPSESDLDLNYDSFPICFVV